MSYVDKTINVISFSESETDICRVTEILKAMCI